MGDEEAKTRPDQPGTHYSQPARPSQICILDRSVFGDGQVAHRREVIEVRVARQRHL